MPRGRYTRKSMVSTGTQTGNFIATRRAKYPKRRYNKKGYQTVNLFNSLNPFPQKIIAKHKYATTVQSTLTSGIISQYLFNANSMYDPDRTGTGHQPFGYDTFATIYNRYRVLGVKYNMSMVSSNSSLTTQLTAIPANEVLASVTSNGYAREMPRARYILQSPQGAGAPTKNLKGYIDIASLMGLTKSQYRANENTQAQAGYSPAELSIINIFFGSMTDDTISFTGYINLELTYVVEWFDPLQVGQS